MSKGKMGVIPVPNQVPTDRLVGLSEAGERLLNVVINPETRTWTVTRICEAARISRDSYYRFFNKDQVFIKLYRENCETACLSHAISVINAMAEAAKNGDVGAGKIMLEMAGMYQHASKVEVHNTNDVGPNLLAMYQTRRKQPECIDVAPTEKDME